MTKGISRRKFVSLSAMTFSGIAVSGFPSIASNMNNQNNIRVGLIGVGNRGLGLAGVIKKTKGLELAACCDVIPENLKRGMKFVTAKSKSYQDYQKLLNDKTIDAVVIATPLYLHFQMAMEALSAGKHIYLEKTMALDIEQSLRLVKEKKKFPNQILQVGHQYRYYDMYPKIQNLIKEGAIGKITHFESQYNRNADWRRAVPKGYTDEQINWRMYKEFSGGLLAELSAHQIDIVNWLTNSHPEKVVAMGDVNYWKDGRTTFDNIRAIYEYPNGIKSSITSILSNAYNSYQTKILGTLGTIEMGRDFAHLYLEPKIKKQMIVDGVTGASKEALEKDAPIKIWTDSTKIEPTTNAFIAFESSMRNKKETASNVLTGKNVAIAVHMGNRSAETGNTEYWKPEYGLI